MTEEAPPSSSFQDDPTLSPEEQRDQLWEYLQRNQPSTPETIRDWPTYDTVLQHLQTADYTQNLTCPFSVKQGDADTNTLCPFGVVACATLEIFAGSPYSGLLSAGQYPALLRLSSALRPPSHGAGRLGRTLLMAMGHKIRNAQLFPCAALKVFRQHGQTGNLLLAGSKLGQRERDFFAHCLATTMTEQMPRIIRPLVQKFWEYSDYPLSLGVSDFCREETSSLVFPFCVVWKPVHHYEIPDDNDDETTSSFDAFLEAAQQIPVGTVLYDVYCCPTPHAVGHQLQRIGRISLTTQFRISQSDGLLFRHQKKEDDYSICPHWKTALAEPCAIGETRGTVGVLAGWKLFEQQISRGQYQDLE